jgi:hypothetical protein
MRPTRVHLVFKSHLDVGFTALAGRVLRRWHEEFFPAALATAAALRAAPDVIAFRWTTGAWLFHDHLERARGADRRRLEAAVRRGDLAWHALPFTLHGEACDASLYDHGLAFSARLDARFGRRTRFAKHTDVPGETLAVVPRLAAAGVRLLHIGLNPCVAAPDVPDLFRWRAPSGAEIVVAYGKTGYGGEIVVPGGRDILRFVHANDNQPPPDADAVRAAFAEARRAHPGADVVTADIDAFADLVWSRRARLPLITAEIGNAWIHGIAADPAKLAGFRRLCAWRRAQLDHRPALARSRAFFDFSTSLLLVAEHTGGLDNKVAVRGPDGVERWTPWGRWDRAGFTADRRAGLFAEWEASWREQRDYLRDAVAALGPGALGRAARAALVPPSVPDPHPDDGWRRVPALGETIENSAWRVRINPRDGALVGLLRRADRREWSGPGNPLGRFHHQVLSASSYEAWWRDYGHAHLRRELWARLDFLKPGLERLRSLREARRPARATALWRRDEPEGLRLRLRLSADPVARRAYGCPPVIDLEWWLPHSGASATFVLHWRDKPASRIPEALWCTFAPRVDPAGWGFRKLDTRIDPREVVAAGGRRLHGVQSCEHPSLSLESADAALVAPGRPDILRRWREAASSRGGLHFNLMNNLWGTNFPLWHEGEDRFEFTLHFREA